MHTLKGHYDTTTSLNYHLHYCSPFAARNHMYRKKVKHVDTSHKDTKINKHEVQQEKDTGVRGSPKSMGYVHQTVTSCDIFSLKVTKKMQHHCCHSTLLLVSQTNFPRIYLICPKEPLIIQFLKLVIG